MNLLNDLKNRSTAGGALFAKPFQGILNDLQNGSTYEAIPA